MPLAKARHIEIITILDYAARAAAVKIRSRKESLEKIRKNLSKQQN